MLEAEMQPSLSPDQDITSSLPSHRRLSFLDAVRGVAAVMVLVQHTAYQYVVALGKKSGIGFDFGEFGVVAFFLVSGFIIPVSLEKYGKLAPFWKARFFRLYPMYWVSLALMLILGYSGIIPFESAIFTTRPAFAVLANVSMLQRFVGVGDALGVYWTLGLEMLFYVICSILAWRHSLRRPVLIAWISIVLVAALNNFLAFGLHHSPLAVHLSLLMTAFVGSVAFRVHTGKAQAKSLYTLIAAAFVIIAEGFWLHFVLLPEAGKQTSATEMVGSWFAAYAFFMVCFALRANQFPQWLQWLGRISFSVYLLHTMVYAVFPDSYGPLVRTFASIVISVLLAWITYEQIERRAIKLGRA